jgi:hypothetical protein
MRCGRMSGEKKASPEEEAGEVWQATMVDMDSRLRAARGIGTDETQASTEVFQILKERGHPDGPPPTISDGWGGIDDAVIAVYGVVPAYSGRGRPPTRKQAQPGWQYLQMVKQRDAHGHLEGIRMRCVFGKKSDLIALMGKSTAYVERSHLTARLFNSRLVRKTLAFSKDLTLHRAAATWQDCYYNLIRPHKSLRLPVEDDPRQRWQKRTPAMAAGLTDHIWTVKELLTLIPLPYQKHT